MKILLYSPHRQVNKIISDLKKENLFFCINMSFLWKMIPLTSKSKLKFGIIGFFLRVLNPSFILTANWISRYDAFYYLWSKKNPNTRFVVIQHGNYVGGNVTVNSHKFIRSNIFLTWGSYHKNLFDKLNNRKKVEIYDFGNPLYNGIDRKKFKYSENNVKNILIVNSGVTEQGVKELKKLVFQLKKNNFKVKLKLHSHQEKKFGSFDYNIELEKKNAYDILNSNEYELFIVDHSSFMIDAIFYKKRVVFFPQYDRGEVFYNNLYSKFLESIKKEDLDNKDFDINEIINIENQENLFNHLIIVRDNNCNYPFIDIQV